MSHWDLTQELFAAMDERFPNNNHTFSTRNRIKTSESHPIKYVPGTRGFCCSLTATGSGCSASTVIAPELLPVISSHLSRNPNPYPILHELPHPFRLYRFNRRPSFSGSPPLQIPRQLSNEIATEAGLRDGASVSQALQLAMSTGIARRGRDLPPRDPTPSGFKVTPALNDQVTTFESKQHVIGNMLLSSCPGKKSASLR